jgi:predicted acylesterase/phospholipase RssA
MPGDQALVLGGGGVAGIAWITGLLTGLAAAGQDVTGADMIIGTSAGATVASAAAGTSTAASGPATTRTWPRGPSGS